MIRFVVRWAVAVLALSGLAIIGGAPPGHADPDGGKSGGDHRKAAAMGDIDAELSGTISSPDGGDFDAEISLYQWDADGEYFGYFDDTYIDSEDGEVNYSFEVPTGYYFIQVYAYGYDADYVSPAYSDGATGPAEDLESAGVVELTEDGAVADIELQAAPDRQPVTGTVTDTDDNPLEGIYLYVDGPSYDESETAADGSFALDLRPGTYDLYVNGGESHEGTSLEIEVGDDGAELDPIKLAAAGQGTIIGKIRNPENAAIAGAEVSLVRLCCYAGAWVDWETIDQVETAADGSYEFSGVRSGQSYTVLASADGYGSRYAGGVRKVTNANLQHVDLENDATFDFGDLTLPVPIAATGRVTGATAAPLSGASVVGYAWYENEWEDGGGYWDQFGTATTNDAGQFSLELPEDEDTKVTFRFARGGFTAQFLGGGSSLPASPDASNSRTVTGQPIALGDVELAPFASKLGKVAGQKLDYCLTHSLAANDDESTDKVDLPFSLKFYGNEFDSIYVNNNGNVTFGSGQYDYTPSALDGPTNRPIIAPFFADVDTSGAGSNIVTYGASPDGKTFCVNWADVGYYYAATDKLNTFQLLLTTNENSPGRSAGDFDIRFNYDEILWETGDASDGENGFGGTSAAVGFSAGTGEDGSYVQLPGSFDNRALIDGGPNALVSGSQNSNQDGRYNFEVRNNGFTSSLGSLQGTVKKANGDAVEGASVSACTASWVCSYGSTNAAGTYSFSALNAGTYTVSVTPPGDDLFPGGTSAVVTSGDTTTVPPIVLGAPVPMPNEVTLNGANSGGVPSVYYGDPIELQLRGCAGVASPTYSVALATGQVIRDGLALTEGPAGVYTATIAPLTPYTGAATITTNVPATCGADPVAFNVYIDPAGIVSDQWGRPITGATVTLFYSETVGGDYEAVPPGDPIMSEDNRNNPVTTGTDGRFQWDVIAGYYKVKAEAPNCQPKTTGSMQIAPERTRLAMKLTCDVAAPAPITAPAVTGTPRVGQKITATAGTWPAPLDATVTLARNGVPLDATEHTLTTSDVNAKFTAVATARTQPANSDEGPGGDEVNVTVEFEAVTATSAEVTGQSAGGGGGGGGGGDTTPSAACQAATADLSTATATLNNAVAAADQASAKLTKAKAKLKKAKKSKNKAKIAKAKKKVKKAKKPAKAAAATQAGAQQAKDAAGTRVAQSC